MRTANGPNADNQSLLVALIAVRDYLFFCQPHRGDPTGAEWGRVMDLSGQAVNAAQQREGV